MVRHPEASGSNLWLADLARGGRTRFTYSKAVDDYPAWSPDGTKIAFSSTRGGHADLYQRAANGAGEDELLLKSESDKYPWDWRRDGRFLLFHETNEMGGTNLAVLPMDGQGQRKSVLFLGSEFFSVNARFSPDGRWVAYTSNESGSYEIYVRPFVALRSYNFIYAYRPIRAWRVHASDDLPCDGFRLKLPLRFLSTSI